MGTRSTSSLPPLTPPACTVGCKYFPLFRVWHQGIQRKGGPHTFFGLPNFLSAPTTTTSANLYFAFIFLLEWPGVAYWGKHNYPGATPRVLCYTDIQSLLLGILWELCPSTPNKTLKKKKQLHSHGDGGWMHKTTNARIVSHEQHDCVPLPPITNRNTQYMLHLPYLQPTARGWWKDRLAPHKISIFFDGQEQNMPGKMLETLYKWVQKKFNWWTTMMTKRLLYMPTRVVGP